MRDKLGLFSRMFYTVRSTCHNYTLDITEPLAYSQIMSILSIAINGMEHVCTKHNYILMFKLKCVINMILN